MKIRCRSCDKLVESSTDWTSGPFICQECAEKGKGSGPTPQANGIIVRQKRWIQTVQCLFFGGFGLFGVCSGVIIALTHMKKADGESADDAILPLLIIGSVMLLLGLMAGAQVLRLRLPAIVATEEKLLLLLVAGSGLNGVWFLPGWIRALYLLLSGKGFRSDLYHATWDKLTAVQVTGIPGLRRIEFLGEFTNTLTGKTAGAITFRDAGLVGDLDNICRAIESIRNAASSAQGVGA